MQAYSLATMAAAPTLATIRAVPAERLDASTPCAEWNVRRLLNHLLYWGPSLADAATDTAGPSPASSEQEADLTQGDWTGRLAAQVDRIALAWRDPDAWEGTTRMGSPDPMPASLIGGMVITELVVHGWDLARATDQRPGWDDRVLAFVRDELEKTAGLGREMGLYGPAVPVPEAAPVLDRLLGLAGRDPDWRP